jgi:hypothetical protein
MLQIVHQLLTGGQGTPSSSNIDDVHGWYEVLPQIQKAFPTIEEMNNFSHPRIFKSHATQAHSPQSDTARFVVVCRDPADVLVSYVKMKRALDSENPTQAEFVEMFTTDFYIYGTWWRSVASWWQVRQRVNVHFVFFEDLKNQFPAVLQGLAQFLGVAPTPEQIARISQNCSFEAMSGNLYFQPRSVGLVGQLAKGHADSDFKFINTGKIGTSKSLLTAEAREHIYRTCQRKILELAPDFPFNERYGHNFLPVVSDPVS